MSGYNLPDDWGAYWRRCDRGHRYHASEGGCGECEAEDERDAEEGDDAAEDDEAERDARRREQGRRRYDKARDPKAQSRAAEVSDAADLMAATGAEWHAVESREHPGEWPDARHLRRGCRGRAQGGGRGGVDPV